MGNNLRASPQHKFRSRSTYWQIDKQENSYSWANNQSQEEWSSLWKDITHQNIYYRSEYGKFNVFRNQIAGEQVERHRVVLKDKKDFEKWREAVEWRNNCPQLVRVEHFEVQNSAQVCVSQFQVNVFLERIPLRLSDLTDIPYPENIYFLLSVVKGFKYISSHPFLLKTFPITESMICVNRDGQVKVWLNSNLAEEMPVDSKQGGHNSQEDLLKGLIDIVEQNTDQRDYPYCFRQYLNDKKIFINGDFNILIQQIYSYAKDMKVAIPNFSSSVRDILTKDLFHNAKFQTEHSTNRIYFQDQSQQIKKQNSFSAINQLDVKNQQQHELFSSIGLANSHQIPRQEFHGIPPPPKNQDIQNNRTNLTLPLDHFQNRFQRNQLNQKNSIRFSSRQIYNKNPESDLNVPQQSYTERPIFFNKIGNNIIQFQRPENNWNSENKNRVQMNALRRHNFQNLNPQVPQGYKMVQRQIIHLPPSYGPAQNQNNLIPHVPYSYSIVPEHHQYQSIQPKLVFNIQNREIRHGNMQMAINPNPSKYVQPEIVQKNANLNLTQTVRPEQLSNPMKIQRISRESSMKGFSQQYSRENLSKTHSFKKNLVKSQHSDHQNTGRVVGLKYFTKKDSEETLDPQIAADLMKFLNRTQQN